MKQIASIEGIGESYANKFKQAGVATVEALLANGAAQSGRRSLAEKTGLSEKLILKWVNMADLFRIKGVGSQYSELLERSGVDTVKELAQRNPEALHKKMAEVNRETKVVRSVPGLKLVQSWVSEAKKLPRKVNY